MNRQFTIGARKIGPGMPAFIVAEVSGNHRQSYEEAEAIVRAAAEAGADAVKLQTYTADTMTIDSDKKWFYLGGEDTPESWKKDNLYKLYTGASTPWEWHPKLQKLAESLGLIFFSTPFDASSVDFLETLNVPCYKIASYEVTDLPLLQKVAATGKPVILSIGFASFAEAEEAIATLRDGGAKDIAVLHCVTAYEGEPDPSIMHLSTVRDIASKLDVVPGFSDNNAGIAFPVMAVGVGACIIEKHLTLSRAAGGPDARFSLEPAEFKAMVRDIRFLEEARGEPHYGPAGDNEANYKNLRRSIFVVRNIRKGEAFTPENLRIIRPAYGIPPKHFDEVMGCSALMDIERGTPLSWEHVSRE